MVVGLELGADDYLVKPFSPAAAGQGPRRPAPQRRRRHRWRATGHGRRAGRRSGPAHGDGRAPGLGLTASEFDLLATLAASPGRVFTRHQLFEVIHGVAVDAGARAIDAHVKNLRRKVEDDSHRPRRILTVHGVGYRLADP